MQDKVQEFIARFKEVYNGDPWYGPALSTYLQKIDSSSAFKCLGNKSIARLCLHMIAWRTLVISRIKGDPLPKIEMNSDRDWPPIEVEDESSWKSIQSSLQDTQEELLTALSQLDVRRLDQHVEGEDYNFSFMINGLMEHEIYHMGQITLLRSLEND